MNYISTKTNRMYSEETIQAAYQSFWGVFKGCESMKEFYGRVPKEDDKSWERFLSALSLEVI